MQISPGEFDSGNTIVHARLDFLNAVDKVCPEARKNLHKRCGFVLDLNAYTQWDLLTHLRNPDNAKATGMWRPEYDTLVTRIAEWQQQYHLTVQWMFDIALHTIMDGPSWRTPTYNPIRYPGRGEFKYAFDLARENEGEIISRLKEALESQLRDEIARTRETALANGARRTKSKRKRDGDEPEEELDALTHFEWLARHVVNDEPYLRIALRYGKTEGGIKKAVQRTAAEIQLILSQKKN